MYNNPWIYNGKEFDEKDIPEESIGFVYLITCLTDNRKYIGRKIFYSTKRLPPLKGKFRKRKKVTNSDWQNYYGSSEEMKDLVLTLGKEAFKREILYLCNSKSSMSYLESKEIFVRDALLKKEFLNNWITCQISGNNLKELYIDENKC
jgi:hypothetical protein